MKIVLTILTALNLLLCPNDSDAQDNLVRKSSTLTKRIATGDSTSESFNELGELYYGQYLEYVHEGYNQAIYHKAIENFKKSIHLNPENYRPYLNIGIAYSPKYIADFGHIKHDTAIYYLEKAIELNTHEKEVAHFYLGLTHFMKYQSQLGKKEHSELLTHFHQATRHYLKAIKIKSNYWQVYDNLGHHYLQKYLKDYSPESLDSSVLFYEKSVDINPDNYMTFFQLGKNYDKKGDLDNAIRSYEESVNLNITSFFIINSC